MTPPFFFRISSGYVSFWSSLIETLQQGIGCRNLSNAIDNTSAMLRMTCVLLRKTSITPDM